MKKALVAVSAALALFSGSGVQAAFVNGGFETGDLSGWSAAGAVSASGSLNYGFGTVNPYAGTTAARLITSGQSAADLAAIMGVSKATLDASNGGTNSTNGAMIYQSTAATAGDTFSFKWNFVEQDYVPYDDWAFYGISIDGGPATVTKFASLATVGPSGGSTINGWVDLTVNITQTGNYTFYFGVVNALDEALNSDLWIDGVGGSGSLGVPEPGSVALLGLGLVGLVAARRRKTK